MDISLLLYIPHNTPSRQGRHNQAIIRLILTVGVLSRNMEAKLPQEDGACFMSPPTPCSLPHSCRLHDLTLHACPSPTTSLQTAAPWPPQALTLLAHPLGGRGHRGPGREPGAKWAGDSGLLVEGPLGLSDSLPCGEGVVGGGLEWGPCTLGPVLCQSQGD